MSFYCRKKYTVEKNPLYNAKTSELLRILLSFNYVNKVENTHKSLDKKAYFRSF